MEGDRSIKPWPKRLMHKWEMAMDEKTKIMREKGRKSGDGKEIFITSGGFQKEERSEG